jgi:hypothetical protein
MNLQKREEISFSGRTTPWRYVFDLYHNYGGGGGGEGEIKKLPRISLSAVWEPETFSEEGSLRFFCRVYCITDRQTDLPASMFSMTRIASWSVICKSSGFPEVQTQRNGPKPSEKMSLRTDTGILHHAQGWETLTLFLLYVPMCVKWSDFSSVGIALGYGLDDRGSRVRFPAAAGNFSLHHRVQNGSGGKVVEAWSWPLTSI